MPHSTHTVAESWYVQTHQLHRDAFLVNVCMEFIFVVIQPSGVWTRVDANLAIQLHDAHHIKLSLVGEPIHASKASKAWDLPR